MSNTERKIIRSKKKHNEHSDMDSGFWDREEVVVDDTQAKFQNRNYAKKMSPFSKKKAPKFVPNVGNNQGPSKGKKQEIKNANRSLKKAERQRLKKELQNEIDECYESRP